MNEVIGITCSRCGGNSMRILYEGKTINRGWLFIERAYICRTCNAVKKHADCTPFVNAPRQPRRDSGVGLDAVVRRDGYQFCETHQQEYRQYCSGCAVGSPAATKEPIA